LDLYCLSFSSYQLGFSGVNSIFQKFDAELFKISMQCICAIAGAIPPDYVDATFSSHTEKKASVDAEGNFDPKPVETTK